ncbi:MAG: hypothetical protein GYA33_09120 [Thermogutta sp.]|nr:hypothetical protein [Thermogutta sp.]
MKTTKHDFGRLISRAQEECDEPIRVSAKAFLAFEVQMQAALDALVADFGNPRRLLRSERRNRRQTPQSPEKSADCS